MMAKISTKDKTPSRCVQRILAVPIVAVSMIGTTMLAFGQNGSAYFAPGNLVISCSGLRQPSEQCASWPAPTAKLSADTGWL